MATNKNIPSASAVRRQTIKVKGFCLFHWLLLIVLLWLQCCHVSAVAIPDRGDVCPDMGQPPVTEPCPYGGYIFNPNPENCKDRYICYAGPGQYCDNVDDNIKCAHGLECHCQVCVNCVGKNCFNILCSKSDGYKRWMKRVGHNLFKWGN